MAAPRSLYLVVALALAGCGAPASPPKEIASEPAVVVETVSLAPGEGLVQASGVIGYRREPRLAFTSYGVIDTIHVDIGDVVRRGQTLATLRRMSAGADAREAETQQSNAERELTRARRLFELGYVTQARLDDAQLAVERSRRAAVLTAPSDGVVLSRLAEPAEAVSPGTTIVVLGQISSGMVLRAGVAATQTARLAVGNRALIRMSEAGGEHRAGRITRIGAVGETATGAVEVEVEFDTVAGLRSGMVATVEFATGAAPGDGGVVVPALALLSARADQGVVLVVDGAGVARRRDVRVGRVTDGGVVVVGGLRPGERVAAAGAAYVRNGDKVRVVKGVR